MYNNGRITFPGDGSSVRRIFMDCYGFVEISLIVSDNSGNKHQYTSEYLPVLVRRGELNDAVKAMVNYVYSNQEILLLNGEPKAKSPANLKEMGYQNLSAPGNENYGDEYIYSSFFMFAETKRMLEVGLTRLTTLRTRFTRLWTMYSGILKIKPEIITIEPRPTHVFLSVPQYNRIFVQIHKWFQFGIYDFTKENFMLSFIKISSLFEGYLLLKMIEYFQSRGYVLESTGKCVYPTRRNWKYKNTKCVNTFLFENDRHKLTLYYQPVIYDTNESRINGIHLIRNNSIPVINGDGDDNRSGGHYYTPDYLIKMEGDSSTRYLILDAKFSDLACVRRYHVRDLAFKYLFSISPVQPADTVVGLCIIYGKCKSSDQIQSAYDKQLQNQKITPITELLPLMESIANDNHYNNLDVLMRKAFISE